MLKHCVIDKITRLSQTFCIFPPFCLTSVFYKSCHRALTQFQSQAHNRHRAVWETGTLWVFSPPVPNQSGLNHVLFSPEFLGKNWLTAPFSILHLLIITSFSPYMSAIKSSCQAKHARSKWPCVLLSVYHISSREFHFQNTRLHNPLALEIGPGPWIYWSRVPRNKNMSIQPD